MQARLGKLLREAFGRQLLRCFPEASSVKVGWPGTRVWRGGARDGPCWWVALVPKADEDFFGVSLAWTRTPVLPEGMGLAYSAPLVAPEGAEGEWVPLPLLFLSSPHAPPAEPGIVVAELPWHLAPPLSLEEMVERLATLQLAPPEVPASTVHAVVDDAVGHLAREGFTFLQAAAGRAGLTLQGAPAWAPEPAEALDPRLRPHARWQPRLNREQTLAALAEIDRTMKRLEPLHAALHRTREGS